jgi:PAS domain S-box-containing protein
MTLLRSQNTRLILPSFVLAMLLLLITGIAAYRQDKRNVAAEQWVRHTYEVLGELNSTLLLIQDVETGSRGYVITGKNSYLEPLNNAALLIPQRIQHLRQLIADNPEQLLRLDRLEPWIHLRMETADKNIAVSRSRELPKPDQTLIEAQGKKSMDEIRSLISQMETAEDELLQRRTNELRASNAQTLAFFIALTVILACLLGAVLLLVRRDSLAVRRELELTEKARAYAESIVDTVREPLLVLDAGLHVQSANRAFYQTFRVTSLETEGKSIYELGSGQWDIPALRPLLAEILPEHTSFQDLEIKGDFPGIGRRTMLLSGRKLFRVGNNTELVLLAIEDITERKLAQEMEQRLAAIVESSEDAIISETLDGTITAWNHGAENLFGYSSSEVLGKPIRILFPPERVNEEGEILARIGRGESVDHFGTSRIRQDGKSVDVWVAISPIKDSHGTIVGASKITRDITERMRAEEQSERLTAQLKEHSAALEAANRELEAFTYSVSHDLRAPLRHIAGFSRILKEDFALHLPAEGQRMIERIQAGARNAGQLVDDLLSLSQVGRKDLKLEIVGLKGLVEQVLKDLEGEAQGREIEWCLGELPFVECDPALMKQVFANLLGNALKYTRPRPRVVIEIGTNKQDGQRAVYVRDNGVGFSMKYADKLFGVFQRLHRSEDFEGTGVGLATVQRIVHKHGGRVWAEAELDKGAMFCFTLSGEPDDGGAE